MFPDCGNQGTLTVPEKGSGVRGDTDVNHSPLTMIVPVWPLKAPVPDVGERTKWTGTGTVFTVSKPVPVPASVPTDVDIVKVPVIR